MWLFRSINKGARMPSDERQRRLQEICSAGLKQDAARRDEFLRTACEDDAELRREIDTLLACELRLGDFLETPATRPWLCRSNSSA
jgi:hypothetical protein